MSGSLSERARKIAEDILSSEKYGVDDSDGIFEKLMSRKVLMTGGIVAVAAIAIGGGAWMWKKHKKY